MDLFALAFGWFLARGETRWAAVAFIGMLLTTDWAQVAENVSAIANSVQ
jgi:hypothetical protein